MDIKTCFSLLDLGPDATMKEAQIAYKAQVRRWHPDQFPVGSITQMEAQEQLKRVNIAYARIKAHITDRPHRLKSPQTQSAARNHNTTPESQAQQAQSRETKRHSWLDALFNIINAFSDPHTTPSSPQRRKGTSRKKQKPFDQVLGEMTGDTILKKTRSSKKSSGKKTMPYRHGKGRGNTIDSVEGIKNPGPIRPIGRVRGIGKNR